MTTVGNKLNIIGENKSAFDYIEHLDFITDYYYRHYDQEEPVPYDEFLSKISSDNKQLVNIYHVLLDLDGDLVVDLYCEVI